MVLKELFNLTRYQNFIFVLEPILEQQLGNFNIVWNVQYKDGSWPKSIAGIVWVCVFGVGIPARFYRIEVIQYKFHHN